MTLINRCRILCVDDNEDIRFLLSAFFEQAGYGVTTAGTIAEALRLARGERFDIYVLDKRFPDGDGTELCRSLRERDPQALIVLYTGAALEEDRQAGFGVGAEAYVIKPDVDGLLTVVNDYLKGRHCWEKKEGRNERGEAAAECHGLQRGLTAVPRAGAPGARLLRGRGGRARHRHALRAGGRPGE